MRIPSPRAAAAALALLAVVAPLAGCRPSAPGAEDIAVRMVAAAESPRPSYSMTTSAYTVTAGFGGAPALRQITRTDAERWTRDADHIRSVITTSVTLLPAEGEVEAATAGAISATAEVHAVTVRNGSVISTYEDAGNTFTSMDVAALEDAGFEPSASESADVLRDAVRDLVAGYDLNPLPVESIEEELVVAGRPAIALAVVPHNANHPALVFDAVRIQRAHAAVDAETFELLGLDLDGLFDVSVVSRQQGANPATSPFGRLGEADLAFDPLPVSVRIETTRYELGPELPDSLFELQPPAGATHVDPLAMATAAAALATGMAGGNDPAAATAVAEAMATTEANPAIAAILNRANATAPVPTTAPRAPASAPPPTSAEAILAANAFGEHASSAGFPLRTPGFIPSGCAVTGSGTIPDPATAADRARLVWASLTCPDGVLLIEQKGAGDIGLPFDETDAVRSNAMVGGERVPTFERADGTRAVLIEDLEGTAIKVSGPQPVATLVRVADAMR
jgi:hypothetical protein